MTVALPTDLPDDAELSAALLPLFARGDSSKPTVAVLCRRPNAYTSSSRSEIVTIGTPLGEQRDFLVKYDRAHRDSTPSCRHGIEYCANVYRTIVAPMPLPHLRALGTIHVGKANLPALVVEHLDQAFRVGEAPEVSGILSAAEWCGAFHRWAESRLDDLGIGFLVRYDVGYYRAWADRAARIAAAARRPAAWLDRTCTAFRVSASTLVTVPTTIIHGEMSPQNVLWRAGKIYPVDWESAAIGPGEIDLAALLFGWPEETVGRCVDAYWKARQVPQPAEFPARWTAATLYTALRWLPTPQGPDDARFTLALDRLRETAESLGIERRS